MERLRSRGRFHSRSKSYVCIDIWTMTSQLEKTKMHSDDRILLLEPIPGKDITNSAGLVDNRLWKGGNRLHAKKDPHGLWYMQYDNGILPPVLRHKYTSIQALIKFAEGYFRGRGLKLIDVVDNFDD